jgi:hypothetical protein
VKQTSEFSVKTIGTALDALTEDMEDLRRAHMTLAWPEAECDVADWAAIVGQIDALGQASARLGVALKSTMLPTLKTLKVLAIQNRAEVEMLDTLATGSLASLDSTSSAPTPAR